ncbi:ribosomal protein S18 acetylase RimI-like enzyme [Flavobacterium sp. 2755]|uniref:GNAT family N-acetyltransferase n=1 Tax=Flavobacterium sp. 2755 TaxID=2817765 RepID=UPI0028622CDD|nr:GNAT family N-acetyltransferase [Flavobacterium sp. 2755]MDR6762037.1 ribosomal protein S18 acetylase RimI-like enzyme [Flavobacterium sp. 2755]
MSKLLYRKALETDIEYLLQLRKETMSEHLINSGIISNDEDQLLRINYLFDQAKIVMLNNQNVGLLKLDEKENRIEIVQIQIDPKFQKKGLGQQIIEEVIKNALAEKKELVLSVLKANPAKELYERLGFKIIGEDEFSFMMLFNLH